MFFNSGGIPDCAHRWTGKRVGQDGSGGCELETRGVSYLLFKPTIVHDPTRDGSDDMGAHKKGSRAGSLGSIPARLAQHHRSTIGGRGLIIGSWQCSLLTCLSMARAACVRRLPNLSSNWLTRTVCEHLLHVRVTSLALPGTLLIVYIMIRILAAFPARHDVHRFPVTLV